MIKINIFSTTEEGYEQLLQWGTLLMTTRRTEALKSMAEEGVVFEGLYTTKTDEYPYFVVGFMYGQNIKPANPARSVNQKHSEIKKKWLKPLKRNWILTALEDMQPIYELSLGDR